MRVIYRGGPKDGVKSSWARGRPMVRRFPRVWRKSQQHVYRLIGDMDAGFEWVYQGIEHER